MSVPHKTLNIHASDRNRIIEQLNNAKAIATVLGPSFQFIIQADHKSLNQNVMAYAILLIIAKLRTTVLDYTYDVDAKSLSQQDMMFKNKLDELASTMTLVPKQPETKIIEKVVVVSQPINILQPTDVAEANTPEMKDVIDNNNREMKRVQDLEKRRIELKEKRKRAKKKRSSAFDTMQNTYKKNYQRGVYTVPNIAKEIKSSTKDTGIKYLYEEQFSSLEITDSQVTNTEIETKITPEKEHTTFKHNTFKKTPTKVIIEHEILTNTKWRTTVDNKTEQVPFSKKIVSTPQPRKTGMSEELTKQIYNTKWRS